MHNSRVVQLDYCQLHKLHHPGFHSYVAVHDGRSCNVAERHLFVKSNLWNGATTVVELDLRWHAQTNPSLKISLSSSLSQDPNHLKYQERG